MKNNAEYALLSLVNFSLFDRCDSDEPEMINICFSLFDQRYRDKLEKINVSKMRDH